MCIKGLNPSQAITPPGTPVTAHHRPVHNKRLWRQKNRLVRSIVRLWEKASNASLIMCSCSMQMPRRARLG